MRARQQAEAFFMVQLVDSDIKTREVLGWKGVHVLHFAGSSCSQKLRIFLNLKGIPWESHPIDLPGNENFRPWFLGINPRGLGAGAGARRAVHIESNDIIQYLEQQFPSRSSSRPARRNEVAALLTHEDDLHLDLRTFELPFRVRAARPAEVRCGAGELCGPRLPAPCRARGTATRTPRSSSGSAPPRKASAMSGCAHRRRNSAPSSTR